MPSRKKSPKGSGTMKALKPKQLAAVKAGKVKGGMNKQELIDYISK